MVKARRRGTETSETRFRLLDTTERVMIEDGYAAVTSRRIAKEAGVTPALVHYYFATIDDLFVGLLRHKAQQQRERHARFLDSPQPLRALWSFSTEPAGAVLLTEFMALANHRKSIAKELAAFAEEFRTAQLEVLARGGIDTGELSPEVLLVLLAAVSRTVVVETDLGMTVGLDETRAYVEGLLERYEGPAD